MFGFHRRQYGPDGHRIIRGARRPVLCEPPEAGWEYPPRRRPWWLVALFPNTRAVVATIVAVLAIAGCLYAAAVSADRYPTPPPHTGHRVCFPKSEWGPAPDHLRPCVYVLLYEDGTFRSTVLHADGTAHPRP